MRVEERIPPTPERLAKGGLRIHTDAQGDYVSCTPAPDTVLAVLIEWGRLEPVCQDYADEYHELKRAFLSPVRFKGRTSEPSGPPQFIAASRYRYVCRIMPAWKRLAVEQATEPGLIPDEIPPSSHYDAAFESLAHAVRQARKEITAETVASEMARLEKQ